MQYGNQLDGGMAAVRSREDRDGNRMKGKRFGTLIALVFVVIMVVFFAFKGQEIDITGTWKGAGGTGNFTNYGSNDTYTFESDGTYTVKYSWGFKERGTYSMTGDTLTMTASNGAEKTWQHVKRVGDTLQESYDSLNGYRVWKKK